MNLLVLIKVIREIVFANVQSTPTPDLSWLPCCHMTWWNLPFPQLQPFSISDPSFPSIPRTHLYHYGHQHLRLCHHRREAFLFLTPPQTSITPSLLTSSNGRLLYFERSVTAFDCLVASKIVVDWRIVGFIVKSVDFAWTLRKLCNFSCSVVLVHWIGVPVAAMDCWRFVHFGVYWRIGYSVPSVHLFIRI